MTVREEVFGEGEVERHEYGGEVESVEAAKREPARLAKRAARGRRLDIPNDVLSHDHEVWWPHLTLDVSLAALPGIAGDGEVVNEGVDPDVDGVVGIVGDGNAPCETSGGARDREVGEVGGLRDVGGREGGEEGCCTRGGLKGCVVWSRVVSSVDVQLPRLNLRLGEDESHSMRRSRKAERRNL